MNPPVNSRLGGVLAFSAYLWWGLIPIYFKQVTEAAPAEIIVHRLVWTMFFMAVIVLGTRRRTQFAAALRDRKTLAALGLSGVCIVTNWLLFVWAVVNNHVHDTSLGYFLNPLLLVFLGLVVLRERLRRWQVVALLIAAAGVLPLGIRIETFPWIALCLPATFGIYGLVRKQLHVDPFVGLLIEMLILSPFAFAYFAWLTIHGGNTFGLDAPGLSATLILAGPVTAVPLVLFAAGARRVRMVTLGFLQYLTPSLSFLLAILVYGEQLDPLKIVTFVLIWAALVIYSLDMAFRGREEPAEAMVEEL